VTAEEFRNVIGGFASGVTVITTVVDGEPFGSTASAMTSLSLEPPMLLVCMNQSSRTGQAIAASRRFAVNVLGEDHADLAVRFAGRSADKFGGCRVAEGRHGVPLLADAIATFECEVERTDVGGTHYIFVATVHVARGTSGAPLAYFRGSFGRLETALDEPTAAALRERILGGTIAHDAPLELDALAAELGTPRGSIFHALSRLAAEGYVDHDASSGAFVVPRVTPRTLLASAHARVAIVVGAALVAMSKAGGDTGELRRRQQALAPAPRTSADVAAWLRSRQALAEQLMSMATDGPVLLDAFRRADVPAQVEAFLGDQAVDRERLAAIHEGYRAIVDAVSDRDHGALMRAAAQLIGEYERLYPVA
jgi:flavin reductase (DIM6/NTAB) family NADH-FMN oxidoreductase RutF/DNA-binding GntR family transcriptional regulator